VYWLLAHLALGHAVLDELKHSNHIGTFIDVVPLVISLLTVVTEITQPCVHTCNGLFICQLYSLPNLLEETDCKEDTPLMLPFCIVRFLLTVDNSDMN
jgi:hypothetical protein